MGFIRANFGKHQICVESRTESFYIHAMYGYRERRIPARDLMPGQYYRGPRGNAIKVDSITEDQVIVGGVFGSPRDGSPVVLCNKAGDPVDHEEDPDSGNFGKHWRENGSPEFLREDLDDIIAALIDFRDNE